MERIYNKKLKLKTNTNNRCETVKVECGVSPPA
jgi:hypothetical protein